MRDYLHENATTNPFVDGVPGKDWWQRFLKQWRCMSEWKPQHLTRKTACVGVPDTNNARFDTLEDVFKNVDLDMPIPAIANRLHVEMCMQQLVQSAESDTACTWCTCYIIPHDNHECITNPNP